MKNSKRKPPAQPSPERVVSHPLYGDIPLIREYGTDQAGKRISSFWWKPDPTFRPRIPPHAVAGDLSKQVYCSACHLPKYFYVDEQKRCIQCGQEFLFSAQEQKYWYERLKFNFHSHAIRCPRCRRQRRSARAWNHQLSEASKQASEFPGDPHALIVLAEVTAGYVEQLKTGNLARAIAAARKAFKLDPTRHEALYWEAVCQELANRHSKAEVVYERFIELASKKKRYQALVQDAEKRKALLRPGLGSLPADA